MWRRWHHLPAQTCQRQPCRKRLQMLLPLRSLLWCGRLSICAASPACKALHALLVVQAWPVPLWLGSY